MWLLIRPNASARRPRSLGAGRADPGGGGDRRRAHRHARHHGSPAASGADVRASAAARCRCRRSRPSRAARPPRAADRCDEAQRPPLLAVKTRRPSPQERGHPRAHASSSPAWLHPCPLKRRSQLRRPTPTRRAPSQRSRNPRVAVSPSPTYADSGRRCSRRSRASAASPGSCSARTPRSPKLRNGTLLLAMSNAGARDSFARGGNEDVLREAMVVVMGADFAVETMVDPSAIAVDRDHRVRRQHSSSRPRRNAST